MKILFVGNTSWSMVNFRLDLMEYLRSKGHEIIVLAPRDEFSLKLEEKALNFVEIKSLERKGMNPFSELKLGIELFQKYRKLRPDYIFHYTIKPNIWGSLAAGILNKFFDAKIKVISVVTGLGYIFIKQNFLIKIVSILFKVALNFNKYVIFLNEDDLKLFKKMKILVDERKGLLMPGEGIDLNYFKPDLAYVGNQEKKVFLFIARLLRDKGIYELIEAAKTIRSQYSDVEIRVLGALDPGNPASITEMQLKKWIDSKTITYLGVTYDVRPYIQAATAIVLPSYQEGLSRVLLEGIAMGKPIIATNVQGCKELVDVGLNGFTVPPRDVPSLVKAFEQVINLSEEQIQEFSKHSLLKSQKYSVTKIIDFYEEILAR